MDKACTPRIGNFLLWVGLGLGVFYWVFEAIMHAVIFQTGGFREALLTDDSMEIWMRVTVFGLLLGFGILSQAMFKRLEKALNEIKVLKGLLPICAKCKKIQDEKGNWNQLEVYIRDHSEAEFSHGFCRECAARYFPDSYSVGLK